MISMEYLDDLIAAVSTLLPALVVVAITVAGLWGANWLLLRRQDLTTEARAPRQVAMLVLTAVGVIIIVLALPVGEGTRTQLLGLLGLVLTAAIALSSTTFLSNAMAGLMLRSVRSFRAGDFIRVGEQFGRVTERGIFHTEIQTEDRDLTSLPNLYLVSNPITVVRASGTIVSATLSLGYDLSHTRIEPLLATAATRAGLEDPFVQVKTLGDYSVTYRVAGFLPEVKHLLTVRSELRKNVLDVLHGAGVEIVSPSFMNQRPLDPDASVIPLERTAATPAKPARDEPAPEDIIFDKADHAERMVDLAAERDRLEAELKTLETRLGKAAGPERETLERERDRLRRESEAVRSELEAGEQPADG